MKDKIEEMKRKLEEAEIRIGKHMTSEPKTVELKGTTIEKQIKMFEQLKALLEMETQNLQTQLMSLEDELQQHKKGGSNG